MSISLSIYDLFANLLPGLLYLFAINEILKSLGVSGLDLDVANFNAGSLVLLALGYILGHIFNSFTYTGWYMWIYRVWRRLTDRLGGVRGKTGVQPKTGNKKDSRRKNRRFSPEDKVHALASINRLYPDLKLKFGPRDSDLLFNAIQVKNKELADRIETIRANAIMMRNISFGLFLLAAAEFINFVGQGMPGYFLAGAACLLGSATSLVQTAKYYDWFYKDVFRTAILYGDSLHAVVDRLRKEPETKRK